MGRWLRAAGYLPDQVLCSTARRARETWELVQPELGSSPAVVYDHGVYEASAERLLELIRRVPSPTGTLLVVGHDPAIPKFALTLAVIAPKGPERTGSDVLPMLDRMRAKFPTAAVAVLEFSGSWNLLAPGSARPACFVTPRDLAVPE